MEAANGVVLNALNFPFAICFSLYDNENVFRSSSITSFQGRDKQRKTKYLIVVLLSTSILEKSTVPVALPKTSSEFTVSSSK